jgi:putative membrane protein insertion efficiency factor
MKWVLIGLLKVYRLVISPLYGNVCRYYPSCSAYALRAVSVHGAAKGTWLAMRRLLRCHPWAAGGYDPVPGTPEFAEELALEKQGGRPPLNPPHRAKNTWARGRSRQAEWIPDIPPPRQHDKV